MAGEAAEPGLAPRLLSEHQAALMHVQGRHTRDTRAQVHTHARTHTTYTCSLLWFHMLYSLPHAQLTPQHSGPGFLPFLTSAC